MEVAFYAAGAIAILATLLTITRTNAVHALLYLILSLLAVAVALFTMGAPFIAALEVIIYAGAIMVLFVFVVMMLNLGERARAQEQQWQPARAWIFPAVLAALLLAEMAYVALHGGAAFLTRAEISPKQIAIALFGPYALGIELASMVLLAAMVGAYHLGLRKPGLRKLGKETIQHDTGAGESRNAAGGDLVHAGIDRPDRPA